MGFIINKKNIFLKVNFVCRKLFDLNQYLFKLLEILLDVRNANAVSSGLSKGLIK